MGREKAESRCASERFVPPCILFLFGSGLMAAAWGQTTPSDQPPAVKPIVTVARQGRELVLNYKLLGPDGQPSTQNASNGRPEFTVHQGKRKVASGQFEYG